MIVYPFLLMVPGFGLLAIAMLGTHSAWSFPAILFGVVLPAVLGRIRLSAICAAGILCAHLLIGDIAVLETALMIVGTCLFETGVAARCPRCATHISERDQPWRGGPPARWCYICGRDRRQVWPLQYVLKPETWHGEYHDQGGGPASVDSIVDWWRSMAFKHWKKRHHHR